MSGDGVDEGEKGLARRDLREIDLTGATLVDTDLRGASLHACDCAAASCLDARLDGCDLSSARISGALNLVVPARRL